MNEDTKLAVLRNDVSKLEKHVQQISDDRIRLNEELKTLNMTHDMYKKETERDYVTIREAFIELLDTYFQYKYRNEDINKSEIKVETYVWMEKSGLL